MVMALFEKKVKMGAELRKGGIKMERLKQSPDGAGQKRVLHLEVGVPLTKAIEKLLDERLVALLLSADGEATAQELPINSVDLTEECESNLDFFGDGEFKEESKPRVSVGQKTGGPAQVKLSKIAIDGKNVSLILKIKCDFILGLWAWIPNMIAGGNFVLGLIPFQGSLDLDAKDAKGEEKKGKRGRPKKEKADAAPVAPPSESAEKED